MDWKFRNAAGKACGTQGWTADHEKASCTIHTGLWRGNKVVALLVAKGDYDDIAPELKKTGEFIVTACNAHDQLVAALKEVFDLNNRSSSYSNHLHETIKKALAAAGVAL